MPKDVLKAVKKHLGAEVKKTEEARQAAKTAVATAEAGCELRMSEMRELLSLARASIIEAEERATEAEERVAVAETRAAATEEAMAEALSQVHAPSPPPQGYSEVPAVAERIVHWYPFSEPSTSVC